MSLFLDFLKSPRIPNGRRKNPMPSSSAWDIHCARRDGKKKMLPPHPRKSPVKPAVSIIWTFSFLDRSSRKSSALVAHRNHGFRSSNGEGRVRENRVGPRKRGPAGCDGFPTPRFCVAVPHRPRHWRQPAFGKARPRATTAGASALVWPTHQLFMAVFRYAAKFWPISNNCL